MSHCIFSGREGKVHEDDILVIAVHFESSTYLTPCQVGSSKRKISLKKFKSSLNFENYDKSFKKAYEHLLNGDCYQINLTFSSLFSFNRRISPHNFIENLWKNNEEIGEYGHCTWLGPLKRLLLSNSPECLFHLKKGRTTHKLYSMPIKGTHKLPKGERQEMAGKS